MRNALVSIVFSCLALACGPASSAPDSGTNVTDSGVASGADAGTDLFAGTWQLKGPIGAGEFVFPLRLVRASDGNYRGEYAGCAMPLQVTTATKLTGQATTCTVTAAQLQDSTYYGSTPQFGSPLTLAFEAGTEVSVVADIMTATGVFNAQTSRVPFTLSGGKK